MLKYAVISITLALVFYTAGVWGEKLHGQLKARHAALFFAGLAFDTAGTTLMSRLAYGGFQLNFHGITGLAAIVLMLVHALWALLVLLRGSTEAKRNFHRFSIIVWAVWLIPYVSGAVMGMAR